MDGSSEDPMRFIRFWILPSVRGLATGVQQRQYTLKGPHRNGASRS
jgi:hypothetical protein